MVSAGLYLNPAPQQQQQQQYDPTRASVTKQKTTAPMTLADVVKAPSEVMIDKNAVGDLMSCQALAEAVYRLDLRTDANTDEQLAHFDWRTLEQCQTQSADLKKLISDLAQHCQKKLEEKECGADLFFVRSYFTKLRLGKTAANDLSDFKEVAELVFAEFYNKDQNAAPDFNRIAELSKRFKELRPDLSGGSKLLASVEVIQGLFATSDSKQKDTAKTLFDSAQKSVDEYERQTGTGAYSDVGKESGFEDSKIAIATQGFQPDRSKALANQMLSKNPEDARAFALRSYSSWLTGDRKNSIQDLKHSIQYSTDAEFKTELQKNLQAIQKPNATVTDYRLGFKIGVDGKDLGL